MIFARYIGPKALNWTEGRVYFAMAGFEDQGTVDMGQVRLQDDLGTWQEVKTDAGLFLFPDFVYAVVVKPVMTFERGQVVKVTNASDEFLEVTGHGYLKADSFEVLDRTNVALGNKVRDARNGVWREISRLDDDLNIGFVGAAGSALWPPDEFVFPVSGGSVLSEPLLKCVKGVDGELVEGQVYSPLEQCGDLVVVVNAAGRPVSYMAERFTEDL